MNIELKSIKHHPSLSEETECYEADLWVDGVKIGHLSNRGTGGCDDFDGDPAAYARADAWCKANLPQWNMGSDQEPRMADTDLELHCGELLAKHIAGKRLDRLMKTRVVMIRTNGDIVALGIKGRKEVTQPMLDAAKRGEPTATILNTLPRDEALARFIAAGG